MLKLTHIPLLTLTLAATPVVALAQIPQSPPPNRQQQSPIVRIQAEAESKIEALLTPEQQRQYRRARRRGESLIEGLDSVTNLSEEQQTEINEIVRKTSRKILDLLPREPRR